jgi:hypothetical protein
MGTLRDAILNAQDLPTEEVATDEWGAFGFPTVRVRGLTAGEREKWERSVGGEDNSKRPTMIRERLVAMTVVDADGKPEFTEGDLKALSNQSSQVIVRLFDAARRLSGMQTEEELEAANPSKGDPEDDSSSDSPSPSE